MNQRLKLWDRYFELFLSEEQIEERVQAIARELNKDYLGKRPIFVAVLNGSVHFASDLTRFFHDKCELSFVKYTSYQGLQSTGKLQRLLGMQENIFGRHVILVEDIVDSGLTVTGICEELATFEPQSLRVATLLYKPKARVHPIKPDYVGFEIANDFVVGYGLDYNGLGRNLSEIYRAI
ncbi:MAG: hypoxanthine phosphoribosyltransferase [Bacteroidia bacterium]